MDGLLSKYAGKKLDRFEKPRGLLNMIAENPGLLADITPVVGGIKGAREEWVAGNPGMALFNAATVPVDLMSMGVGGAAAKLALLGATRGKGFNQVPGILEDLYRTYEATGEIKKLPKVEAVVLTDAEKAAFNSTRTGKMPKLDKNELGYRGNHHFKGRGPTDVGNDYEQSDLLSQLESVTSNDLVLRQDKSGAALQNPKSRIDAYGKRVKDKMVIDVSPNGAGEVFSIIPEGDGLSKGQKVQKSAPLISGEQAHPISDVIQNGLLSAPSEQTIARNAGLLDFAPMPKPTISETGDVLLGGNPIGRVKIDKMGNATRIADINLLGQHQGQGYGSSVINDIVAQSHANGLPVVLTSDAMRGKANQARQRALYERLGFEKNKTLKTDGVREEYVFYPPKK